MDKIDFREALNLKHHGINSVTIRYLTKIRKDTFGYDEVHLGSMGATFRA